ncbi:MAG TPA: phage head closure protein [Dehalococcoidales bacterium]|nr:phage head closure protein [Dehalococcoidales bacterium]
MRAGTLRQRLTFQEVTRARNDFNEMVDSWSDYCVVWGSLLPNAGRKYYEAKQATAEVSGEVRIRYRSGILPTMRILHGSRILEIVSIVNPQERNRELLIYYKEKLD